MCGTVAPLGYAVRLEGRRRRNNDAGRGQGEKAGEKGNNEPKAKEDEVLWAKEGRGRDAGISAAPRLNSGYWGTGGKETRVRSK